MYYANRFGRRYNYDNNVLVLPTLLTFKHLYRLLNISFKTPSTRCSYLRVQQVKVFMSFEEFQQEYKRKIESKRWLHVLPAVPYSCRQRFLNVLALGVKTPRAYDFILLTQHMSDDEFEQKLRDSNRRKIM